MNISETHRCIYNIYVGIDVRGYIFTVRQFHPFIGLKTKDGNSSD